MVLILLLTGWLSFASSDSLVVDSIVKPIKDIKVTSVKDSLTQAEPEPAPDSTMPVRRDVPRESTPRPEPIEALDVPGESQAEPDTMIQATITSENPVSDSTGYGTFIGIGIVILIALMMFFRRRGSASKASVPSTGSSDEPVRKTNDAHSLQVDQMMIRLGQAQHLGMRRQQQDAFWMSDPATSPFIAVIADGMGGMKNGAEASKLAILAFMESLDVNAANRAVYELGKESGAEEGTGTTLLAVMFEDRSMNWICVGDSQIYLLRNGELSKVNVEHSYVLDLYQDVIRGQTDLSDARRHPEKDALTSFLGLKDLTRIDRSRTPFPLKQADVILMCSDGLYRSLSDSEMIDILSGDSPNPAEELVRRAMAKNHPYQDNTTVITLQIDQLL